jgi:hypothetical protein
MEWFAEVDSCVLASIFEQTARPHNCQEVDYGLEGPGSKNDCQRTVLSRAMIPAYLEER